MRILAILFIGAASATALDFDRRLTRNHETITYMIRNIFNRQCKKTRKNGFLLLQCNGNGMSAVFKSQDGVDPVPVSLTVCEKIQGQKMCDTIFIRKEKDTPLPP